MAVPMTLSDAADLIDLSIQTIHPKMTNLEAENYKLYYNAQTTEDYYDKDSSLSALGEAARITENVIPVSESPVQGFDRTYTQVFMGKMAQFTMYDWKFGIKKRKLEGVVKDLDRACRRKRERLTTEYIENSIAAATSYTVSDDAGNYTKAVTGGDSLALVHASHTREDGGASWSNIVSDGTTSNMDFEYDALKAAHRTSSLILDPKGNLMNIDLDTVVVRKNSSNHFRAMEILKALQKGDIPGSFDHDGAGIPAFRILALPYLTNTNAAYWWMFDSKMMGDEYGLQYRESQGIAMEGPYTDFKTGSIYYKSTMAFDYGHNDGRNWVGSTGANS
jgi:hypothetical protein